MEKCHDSLGWVLCLAQWSYTRVKNRVTWRNVKTIDSYVHPSLPNQVIFEEERELYSKKKKIFQGNLVRSQSGIYQSQLSVEQQDLYMKFFSLLNTTVLFSLQLAEFLDVRDEKSCLFVLLKYS